MTLMFKVELLTVLFSISCLYFLILVFSFQMIVQGEYNVSALNADFLCLFELLGKFKKYTISNDI